MVPLIIGSLHMQKVKDLNKKVVSFKTLPKQTDKTITLIEGLFTIKISSGSFDYKKVVCKN